MEENIKIEISIRKQTSFKTILEVKNPNKML